MKLIFADPNPLVADALSKAFAYEIDVESLNGHFQDVYVEGACMTTAGNSFGLMDGGVDYAVSSYFAKYNLAERIRVRIKESFRGEQPVGTSFIVPTYMSEETGYRWVAHTPTMRVPQNISETDNVYLAMFATLTAVTNFNADTGGIINTLVCPGLGTSAGQMDPDEAARQMFLAYQNSKTPPRQIDWPTALDRQQELRVW